MARPVRFDAGQRMEQYHGADRPSGNSGLVCRLDILIGIVAYLNLSHRLDLLSPPSAFRFPMPGGDGQSLQRHRSTSTPNVHMVSTVGPVGASIIEVSVCTRFDLVAIVTR